MKDELGDRMKAYEAPFDIVIPRRNYMLMRLDGVAFHSFTKGYKRPYDETLVTMMDETAKALCEQISGAEFAFVQSDEISIVVTDFKKIGTQPWFGKRLSKVLSVPAGMATSEFNRQLMLSKFTDCEFPMSEASISGDSIANLKMGTFDNRVWIMSEIEEVINYYIWRQQDCTRNSISMSAQTYFSHNKLEGVNTDQMQEMLFKEEGINWNDYKTAYKRGRMIHKVYYEVILAEDRRTVIDRIEISQSEFERIKSDKKDKTPVRSEWIVNTEIPIFTKEKEFLRDKLPKL